jgi:hypothetical protein
MDDVEPKGLATQGGNTNPILERILNELLAFRREFATSRDDVNTRLERVERELAGIHQAIRELDTRFIQHLERS